MLVSTATCEAAGISRATAELAREAAVNSGLHPLLLALVAPLKWSGTLWLDAQQEIKVAARAVGCGDACLVLPSELRLLAPVPTSAVRLHNGALEAAGFVVTPKKILGNENALHKFCRRLAEDKVVARALLPSGCTLLLWPRLHAGPGGEPRLVALVQEEAAQRGLFLSNK